MILHPVAEVKRLGPVLEELLAVSALMCQDFF